LDLFFDSVEERQRWQDLLAVLVDKELGRLPVLKIEDAPDSSDFDRLVTYASIGKMPEKYYQAHAWNMSLDEK
jgi:hypothetical protein